MSGSLIDGKEQETHASSKSFMTCALRTFCTSATPRLTAATRSTLEKVLKRCESSRTAASACAVSLYFRDLARRVSWSKALTARMSQSVRGENSEGREGSTEHLEALESVHRGDEVAFCKVEGLNVPSDVANNDLTLGRGVSNGGHLREKVLLEVMSACTRGRRGRKRQRTPMSSCKSPIRRGSWSCSNSFVNASTSVRMS